MGIQPYALLNLECLICKKEYKNEHTLKLHIERLHNHEKGLKTFKCECCERAFPTNARRKIHVNQTYQNIRNYQCHSCDKKFKRQAHLSGHILSVHYFIYLFYFRFDSHNDRSTYMAMFIGTDVNCQLGEGLLKQINQLTFVIGDTCQMSNNYD